MEASVQIVGRVARILGCVSGAGATGRPLSDVTRLTGLGKTTAHRILTALSEVGYVTRDDIAQRYRIGPEIVRLAASAEGRDLARIAVPLMRAIAHRTQDTVFLSVRDGREAVCIAREVGRFPIKTLTLDPGDRRPLGVGAGSAALLAAVSDDEIDGVLDAVEPMLERYPSFDRPRLERDRSATLARGWSLNEDGVIEGMSAVGVALRDGEGRCVAAISVAAITSRMTSGRRTEIVAELQAAAIAVEAAYADLSPSREEAA